MNVSDVVSLVIAVILMFTGVCVIIFFSKLGKVISIQVTVTMPKVETKSLPTAQDIQALQNSLDVAKVNNDNASQGIDTMLAELNDYMTGGNPNVQDK